MRCSWLFFITQLTFLEELPANRQYFRLAFTKFVKPKWKKKSKIYHLNFSHCSLMPNWCMSSHVLRKRKNIVFFNQCSHKLWMILYNPYTINIYIPQQLVYLCLKVSFLTKVLNGSPLKWDDLFWGIMLTE